MINYLESLGAAMDALLKEKQRQEAVELARIKETSRALKQSVKLEYLRQRRERELQRDEWQRRQKQISYRERQQARMAELEAAKILYQDEVEKLKMLAENAQGIESERLRLLAQRRELEIMELEQELAGVRSRGQSWLGLQIQQKSSLTLTTTYSLSLANTAPLS